MNTLLKKQDSHSCERRGIDGGSHEEISPHELDLPQLFFCAENKHDFETAFNLVYRSYLRIGLCEFSELKMRYTLFNFLKTTISCLSIHKQKLEHTLSIFQESEFGLPCESVFSKEVNHLKRKFSQLTEVGMLASEKNDFKSILDFMCYTIRMCKEKLNSEALLITVHPRHALMYENVFRFKSFPNIVNYASVNNHPAQLLYLELDKLETHFKEEFGNVSINRRIKSLLLNEKPGYFMFNVSEKNHWTPQFAQDLLSSNKEIQDGMNQKWGNYLSKNYQLQINSTSKNKTIYG